MTVTLLLTVLSGCGEKTTLDPDNTSEPMDLRVLPMPGAAGQALLVTQAGAGLCATKTTDQKAEAAGIFARWLTEPGRNLEFCVGTGYMPVTQEAFAQIGDYDFSSETYRRLYTTLNTVNETATAVREPSFAVRFHNRNIYTTLGVSSLKQLLRCAAIMKQEDTDCKNSRASGV